MKYMARQGISPSEIERPNNRNIVEYIENNIFIGIKERFGEDISLTDIKIEWFAEVYNTNNGEIDRIKWVKGEEIPRHTRILVCEGSNIVY